MSVERVDLILEEARSKQNIREFFHRYEKTLKCRKFAESQEVKREQRKCGGCGGGLKWKNTGVDTIALCVQCGMTCVFPGELLDGSVGLGEEFLPGVSGIPKGYVAARIRNGKIVGVEG